MLMYSIVTENKWGNIYGLLFVKDLFRSRAKKQTHTLYTSFTGIFRWAISTGWEEHPLPVAPTVSTLTSSSPDSVHTPPAHTSHPHVNNRPYTSAENSVSWFIHTGDPSL